MALIEQIVQLPVSDRIELVEKIWDSISVNDDSIALTARQADELKWRIKNPSDETFSWDEVKARARASKT